MKEIMISQREEGQRLDRFLGKYMDRAPTGFFYKMMRKKNIVLNGKKATGGEKLHAGDQIKLFLSQETIEKFSGAVPVSLPEPQTELAVLYEDDHVLLVNKPVGMLSQKAKASDVSLVELITSYLLETGSLTRSDLRSFRPGICNRLDRNTSGIVTAGKSLAGLQALSLGFRQRSFGKYYRCLVRGNVTEGRHVRGYLRKDAGKNQSVIEANQTEGADFIETEYRPIKAGNGYTLLEVRLLTGKPHQIRAHLASEGYPILGDYKYGDRKTNDRFRKEYGLSSQLLHAYRLEFPRLDSVLAPLSGRIFCAGEPELFLRIQKNLIGKTEE